VGDEREIKQHMGRKYSNPPIIEAICEFKFAPSSAWDITVPGLLFEKIRADFPLKEQTVRNEIRLEQTQDGVKQHVEVNQLATFLAENRTPFVMVADRHLSIHFTAPYPSWTKVLPTLETVWVALHQIVSPLKIARIGLRFVNRITFKNLADFNIPEYFLFRPELGPSLPQPMAQFAIMAAIPYESENDLCRFQLVSIDNDQPDAMDFLLDIDYALMNVDAVSPDSALQWVATAHDHIEEVFESCITDKLRATFSEIVNE
jgi:uncharacterized protein (TIGR04255 family)